MLFNFDFSLCLILIINRFSPSTSPIHCILYTQHRKSRLSSVSSRLPLYSLLCMNDTYQTFQSDVKCSKLIFLFFSHCCFKREQGSKESDRIKDYSCLSCNVPLNSSIQAFYKVSTSLWKPLTSRPLLMEFNNQQFFSRQWYAFTTFCF